VDGVEEVCVAVGRAGYDEVVGCVPDEAFNGSLMHSIAHEFFLVD